MRIRAELQRKRQSNQRTQSSTSHSQSRTRRRESRNPFTALYTGSSYERAQAKLRLGISNDFYEQEADKVAENLVSGKKSESITPLSGNSGGVNVSLDVSNKLQSESGKGSPLPDSVKSKFESGLNTDLSDVRVHTDSTANDLSQSLQAKALTYGKDIYFNEGEYKPGTQEGDKLLAHEVTHTVQQTSAEKVQRTESDEKLDSEQSTRMEMFNFFSIFDFEKLRKIFSLLKSEQLIEIEKELFRNDRRKVNEEPEQIIEKTKLINEIITEIDTNKALSQSNLFRNNENQKNNLLTLQQKGIHNPFSLEQEELLISPMNNFLPLEQKESLINPAEKVSKTTTDSSNFNFASNFNLSDKGTDLLKEMEGLRLKPYDDHTGKEITEWLQGATIGYGHYIYQKEWNKYKTGIDSVQAENLFKNDLVKNSKVVKEHITSKITQNQYDALAIFAFNASGFIPTSTLKKMINNPNYESKEYPTLEDAWKAFHKITEGDSLVPNEGLINRRQSEWDIYSKGIYQGW